MNLQSERVKKYIVDIHIVSFKSRYVLLNVLCLCRATVNCYGHVNAQMRQNIGEFLCCCYNIFVLVCTETQGKIWSYLKVIVLTPQVKEM